MCWGLLVFKDACSAARTDARLSACLVTGIMWRPLHTLGPHMLLISLHFSGFPKFYTPASYPEFASNYVGIQLMYVNY